MANGVFMNATRSQINTENIKPPKTLMVVVYVLLIISTVCLVGTPVRILYVGLHKQGLLPNTQTIMLVEVLGFFLALIGVGMMKGQYWAKLMYLIAMPILILFDWFRYGFKYQKLGMVVFYLIVCIIITGKKTQDYFSKQKKPLPSTKSTVGRHRTGRRVLSVLVFIVGGSCVYLGLSATVLRLIMGDYFLAVRVATYPLTGLALLILGLRLWGRTHRLTVAGLFFFCIALALVLRATNLSDDRLLRDLVISQLFSMSLCTLISTLCFSVLILRDRNYRACREIL